MSLRDPPYCIWMLHWVHGVYSEQETSACNDWQASIWHNLFCSRSIPHTSNFQVKFKFLWLCNHCTILCNIAHSQCGFTGARPCCPTFEQSQVHVLYSYCDSHFAQHLCVTVGIGQHQKMASLAWLQWFGELTALNATHVHMLVHASTVLISM